VSKLIIGLFFISSLLFAELDETIIDCNKVFEERKHELLAEIEKIDEKQQALESLQLATKKMLDKKEAKLADKEADINASLVKIQQIKKNVEEMDKRNKKALDEIKVAKDDKITASFEKLGAKAAPILEEMINSNELERATSILFNLKAKAIANVLKKMDPVKAGEMTVLLKKGPPFRKKRSRGVINK